MALTNQQTAAQYHRCIRLLHYLTAAGYRWPEHCPTSAGLLHTDCARCSGLHQLPMQGYAIQCPKLDASLTCWPEICELSYEPASAPFGTFFRNTGIRQQASHDTAARSLRRVILSTILKPGCILRKRKRPSRCRQPSWEPRLHRRACFLKMLSSCQMTALGGRWTT